MSRCARCSGEKSSFAVFCPHCAQAQEPDFDLLIGQTLADRYRIYRRLGRGGLSTVFAATDLMTDQITAIKVSDPSQLVRRDLSYAINESEARSYWAELLERMRREAETLAAIDHPNIVRFYGTGAINEDIRYVTMEFLRGRTLREELDEFGRMEISETTQWLAEVAAALAEVHARGIIHRDINPKNIFLCGSSIKLIDFGIAKFPQPEGVPPFTRHSLMSGTVAYASPEQCQAQALDHRSDIYSLGIVAYEMLTGERPFQGRTPTEIALKQIQAQPISPRALNASVSVSLEQAILRALAKEPTARYRCINDFAKELCARSNQIVIPLEGLPEGLPEANTDFAFEDMNDTAIVEPKSRRQWRRATMASAGLLAALITAGLAWDYLSSSNIGTFGTSATTPSPSPSPTEVQGSDADALELAAKLPNSTGASARGPARPGSTGPGAAAGQDSASGAASKDPAALKTVQGELPPRPSEKLPIGTMNKPAPNSQSPESEPKENVGNLPIGQPDSSQSADSSPQNSISSAAKERDQITGDKQTGAQDSMTAPGPLARRPDSRPDSQGKNNVDEEAEDRQDEEMDTIGPKLIQWSGPVTGSREIKIETPGVPGRIEIPRVYRDRVGIVDPPNAENRWRCVVVRIFGRGQISFVMRWWPMASRGRYAARAR